MFRIVAYELIAAEAWIFAEGSMLPLAGTTLMSASARVVDPNSPRLPCSPVSFFRLTVMVPCPSSR